jgi:hypothetical protein
VIARRVTQRTVAAGALALALPVLTGCGLEAKDETSKEHTQIQAASEHIGAIKIRNAFLTTVPSTDGVTAGATYLVVTLVNDGQSADALTGVTTSFGSATLSSGSVTLPPGLVTAISDPEIDADATTVVISADTAPTVGTTEQVELTFATAGTTDEIDVPVVDPDGSLDPTQVIPTTQATVATPIV